MPILYQRVNAGGQNTSPLSDSQFDFNSAPQHPHVSAPSKTHHSSAMDRRSQTPQGTSMDPFDDLLVGSQHSNAPPALAPGSTHGPLGLDPLADLWQPDTGGNDLLGLTPQQGSSGSTLQPPNRHLDDPWDMFDSPRHNPASQQQPAPSQRSQTQPTASRRLAGIGSEGDLLQLHEDELLGQGSHTAPHTTHHSANGVAAPDHGMHACASTPDMASSAWRGTSPEPASGSGTAGEDGGTQAAEGEGGAGNGSEQRELYIYAIPLGREKLVFLPIRGWQEEPKPVPTGVAGSFQAGITRIQDTVSTMWNQMGNKDPSTLQGKIHAHGQAVLENMTAEERLMRYIPKAATKVIVYHPASIMPCEVQEQLQKMTSSFMVKATGKAAAAGLLLPVAVGIEMIAVPGTGWYALYQLYKSSVSVKGVNRLSQYLNHASNVRVCYAGMPKLDQYVERARLSPDGLLTQDDVDDLCHELEEPGLQHPLTELRNRYLKRVTHKTGEYALLPANDTDDSPYEGHGSSEGSSTQGQKQGQGKSMASMLQFWKSG